MNHLLKKWASEPFLIFFPLGTLFGLVAAIYWPLVLWFGFNHSSLFHIYLMVGGFITFFIIGFLTTALPRLTQTQTLSQLELILLLFSSLSAVFCIMMGFYKASNLFLLTTFLALIITLLKRFLKKQRMPPQTFVYIPLGLFSVMTGTIIKLINDFSIFSFNFSWHFLSTKLITEALPLFLILGVGGFLVRSILGWAPPLPESTSDKPPDFHFSKKIFGMHILCGIGLLGSYLLEVFYNQTFGITIRAILVTLYAIFQIKIYHKPISKKLTSITLWISMWLIVAGFWIATAYFQDIMLQKTLFHFIFIGGFSITTYSVATRVIFSHCGYSHLLQGTYWPFTIAVSLWMLGLFTRILAGVLPATQATHLTYAALAWALGVLIWSIFVLSKVFKKTFS